MQRFRTIVTAAICLSTIAASGCKRQEIFPVEGKIVFSDGQPASELQGGFVVFDSMDRKAGARGVVDADGNFAISTEGDDDGAYLGKHRVQIGIPKSIPEGGPKRNVTMDPKYTRFNTSGLEVTVEPKHNDVTLTIERRSK